ncbi:hypothetical protein M8494_37325 [Serratia ureilytica]
MILRCIRKKGPDFLDDLQGMFAFALYDTEKDAYLIGRDRTGHHPAVHGPRRARQPVRRLGNESAGAVLHHRNFRPAATCGARTVRSANTIAATGSITTASKTT